MHETTNKQMDSLVKKVILKASLETPSFDFTTQIITQLAAQKQSECTIYKPLISKNVWLTIIAGFAVLIGYSFFGMQQENQDLVVNFDFFTHAIAFDKIPKIIFSKTVMYALLFLSIMVLIQITVLKDYLDKRFEN